MKKNKSYFRIDHLRQEYLRDTLNFKNLPKDPFFLFDSWIKEAYASKILEPNAMTLATVNKNGYPYQRIVLLKKYSINKLIFYTNFNSRKANHICNNDNVSLHFFWNKFERQVMFLGKIKKLSFKESSNYFYSRPYLNQISTWVSNQSNYISCRNILEKKFLQYQKKFKENEVPYPLFWGGFFVIYNIVEFWQGRSYRLHDRFIYKKKNKKWTINRLSP
ncbi:pyridoxamine 5'-phosphate oxidase [Candidatus Tachikawaea gelatinosa]|uniref:Pyridoxine/pyridoxamine 5'-phosphate oxidase n=1 Tax=Candidatus Tachikawaea gelatinosa TaxID=1410383 RepID=A0A090AJA4_9ENTR|nr:pyridoxamine 5'-phosphate oxidase [Candidatus Tachikawaea gelatinosa]BAP58523.1 pyridoxine/pyridoxamine 5'-phosphate oxidase [Candidatus Tachikawaea gelatinosa]